MLLLLWFVPSKVGTQGKEFLKYGGRGRSRTHQALSQPLTGFEDQAPHRGRRSSNILGLNTQRALHISTGHKYAHVAFPAGEVQAIKVLQNLNGKVAPGPKFIFQTSHR